MKRKLGLFDSGIGGLTVLIKLIERYPQFDYFYLADTLNLPYGDKSKSQIRNFALDIKTWFHIQKIDALFIACNSTNSVATDIFQNFPHIPFFDLISAASEMISSDKIGVLATEATVRSLKYTEKILMRKPNAQVFEVSCPGLVQRIEGFPHNSMQTKVMLEKYLKPLLDKQVDEIILGCSHYPFLIPLMRELIPARIKITDPAVGLANRTDVFSEMPKEFKPKNLDFSNVEFFTTSDVDNFSEKIKNICKINKEINLISLRTKP